MTVSYWQDGSANETIECDVCVVGAGIVGLYLARLIAGRGQSVYVLEARHVAAGASGRNAGMVLTGTAYYYHDAIQAYGRELAHKIWELTTHNRDITRGLSEEFDTPWDARGSLLLALDDTEAEDLERSALSMLEDGIPCQFTHKDPTKRGFAASLTQPGDAGIHPVKFAEALAASSGATIYEQAEVFAIEPLPGGGVELKSRRATVRCRVAALCTNAYAPLLHPYFMGKVLPTRGQIICTEPLGATILTQVCYGDYGYEYFRQLSDGRLLLGGWRHHFREAEVGYEDRTTPDVQAGLQAFLERYFPEAKGARITHRWSGTMGFSMDGLPLVGELPDLPGVYFAVGFTGHGLGMGLATAERLAEHMLTGNELDWLDARRLDPVPERNPMKDETIQEQIEYYRARAQEYDDSVFGTGRFSLRTADARNWEGLMGEQALAAQALVGMGPFEHALELACGTGIWTEILLRVAREVAAVDASPEMLEINKAKVGDARVSYVQADLFEWEPDGRYDLVFFANWLSHVPPERLDTFLEKVCRATRPGGTLFIVDQYAPTEEDRAIQEDEVRQLRTLLDGSTFSIMKVFYDLQELEEKLTGLGFKGDSHKVGESCFYLKGTLT